MKRVCKYCGDPLHGRMDKKYCSDHCRSAFHYEMHRDEGRTLRKIDSILKRNRRILIRLLKNGRSTVRKRELSLEGFNFHFKTHESEHSTKKKLHYCYEVGYIEEDNATVTLCRESHIS